MLNTGSRAPEINGQDLSGGPVLVAFFKVSCPTCQLTFPYLQQLADAGWRVLGISQDGPAPTEAFRRQYGLRFPVALDPAGEQYPASNAYKIMHVPSIFVVNPEGIIESAVEGFSRRDLEEIGERVGFVLFAEGEPVPAFRPG